MGTPHKYAALIKAWADGATIQYLRPATAAEARQRLKTIWDDIQTPTWHPSIQYRVKPVYKTPGQIAREAWYSNVKDYLDASLWELVGKAVIEAYKNDEVNLDEKNT